MPSKPHTNCLPCIDMVYVHVYIYVYICVYVCICVYIYRERYACVFMYMWSVRSLPCKQWKRCCCTKYRHRKRFSLFLSLSLYFTERSTARERGKERDKAREEKAGKRREKERKKKRRTYQHTALFTAPHMYMYVCACFLFFWKREKEKETYIPTHIKKHAHTCTVYICGALNSAAKQATHTHARKHTPVRKCTHTYVRVIILRSIAAQTTNQKEPCIIGLFPQNKGTNTHVHIHIYTVMHTHTCTCTRKR